MKLEMKKEISFHITFDDTELIALYKIVQKLRNGLDGHDITGYKISEFEVEDEEMNLIDSLDNYIIHSDAFEELKLGSSE